MTNTLAYFDQVKLDKEKCCTPIPLSCIC